MKKIFLKLRHKKKLIQTSKEKKIISKIRNQK